MCYVPGATEMAIASTVMNATAGIVSFMGAAQQANDVNAAFRQNEAAALAAYSNDIEANNLNTLASQERSSQAAQQAQAEGLAARASARAGSSDRGIGGLTAAAIEQDLGFQEGRNMAAIQRNADLDLQRNRLAGRAARDTAQSRINSAPRQRGPSLLALGTNIGSSVVDGFTMRAQLRAYQNGAG